MIFSFIAAAAGVMISSGLGSLSFSSTSYCLFKTSFGTSGSLSFLFDSSLVRFCFSWKVLLWPMILSTVSLFSAWAGCCSILVSTFGTSWGFGTSYSFGASGFGYSTYFGFSSTFFLLLSLWLSINFFLRSDNFLHFICLLLSSICRIFWLLSIFLLSFDLIFLEYFFGSILIMRFLDLIDVRDNFLLFWLLVKSNISSWLLGFVRLDLLSIDHHRSIPLALLVIE